MLNDHASFQALLDETATLNRKLEVAIDLYAKAKHISLEEARNNVRCVAEAQDKFKRARSVRDRFRNEVLGS